jgi:hypothetical protein
MRSWLGRWRWWLLFGGLSAIALVCSAFVLAPSPVRPFDRIELGMTSKEVDGIVEEVLEIERRGGDVLISNEESTEPLPQDQDPVVPHEQALKPYYFASGSITVGFLDDRAMFKSAISSNPKQTVWGKIRSFLNRTRPPSTVPSKVSSGRSS